MRTNICKFLILAQFVWLMLCVYMISLKIMFTIPRLENVGKTRLQTQSWVNVEFFYHVFLLFETWLCFYLSCKLRLTGKEFIIWFSTIHKAMTWFFQIKMLLSHYIKSRSHRNIRKIVSLWCPKYHKFQSLFGLFFMIIVN